VTSASARFIHSRATREPDGRVPAHGPPRITGAVPAPPREVTTTRTAAPRLPSGWPIPRPARGGIGITGRRPLGGSPTPPGRSPCSPVPAAGRGSPPPAGTDTVGSDGAAAGAGQVPGRDERIEGHRRQSVVVGLQRRAQIWHAQNTCPAAQHDGAFQVLSWGTPHRRAPALPAPGHRPHLHQSPPQANRRYRRPAPRQDHRRAASVAPDGRRLGSPGGVHRRWQSWQDLPRFRVFRASHGGEGEAGIRWSGVLVVRDVRLCPADAGTVDAQVLRKEAKWIPRRNRRRPRRGRLSLGRRQREESLPFSPGPSGGRTLFGVASCCSPGWEPPMPCPSSFSRWAAGLRGRRPGWPSPRSPTSSWSRPTAPVIVLGAILASPVAYLLATAFGSRGTFDDTLVRRGTGDLHCHLVLPCPGLRQRLVGRRPAQAVTRADPADAAATQDSGRRLPGST